MAIQKYKKIGIRRDNNFGDLSNTKDALNNLLGKLVVGTPYTFISEDLDAIRGISALGLSNSGYKQIVGTGVLVSTPSGGTNFAVPRVTLQNQLDTFSVFSGKPRIFGGNGLTAKYYDSTDVYENTVGIFSGDPARIDNFWEEGNFNYTGKITPETIDIGGGVQWEGYFIPIQNGSHTFIVRSSSCFTMDFETEGYTTGIGTYTEISRVGIATTLSGSGTINTNTITLTTATNAKYVAIGQSVSASGIIDGTIVESVAQSTGVITLTPPAGITYALSTNVNGNITFSKSIGQNTEVRYNSYVLEAQRRYRIRWRYFIPNSINASSAQRYIYFRVVEPISAGDFLRYNYLYSLDYDFSNSAKGTFNVFLDNSVNFGGGVIGSFSNPSNYVKVSTSNIIDVRYQPKRVVSEIIKSSTTGSITSGTKILSTSNTSGIEIGNYVFGTGIPEGTRVENIIINDSVFLSQNATSTTSSQSYTFIDHRGFVKRAVGSGSAGSLTLSSGDTSGLKSGMIVIGAGIQTYTGITTTGNISSFQISPSQTIAAGTTVYFYQSKGLINNGLDAFCSINETKCMLVTSLTPIGSTVIPVSDSTGVGNGWKVQGSQFASGTTVSGAPSSSTSITISQPTIRSITAGSNFTVTNATGTRTLCCPPTDTSPPFNPTLDGLETISAAPNLRIDSGNLVFGSFKANIGIASITSATSSNTSNIRLSIQTPSVQVGTSQTTVFKILCGS